VNKTVKIAIFVQAIMALGLCFVPLLNVLSYEFSLSVSILTTLTSFYIGLSIATSTKTYRRACTRAIGYSYLQLILPLAIICLNALRVRNCDFSVGLIFFAILPVTAATLNAPLGILAHALFNPKTWAAKLGSASLLLGVPLLSIFWDFYSQPPISIYSHVWGYNPGTLYDEAIAPDERLLAWRCATFAAAILIVALVNLFDKIQLGTLHKIVVATLLALGFYAADQSVGAEKLYRVNRDVLEQRLSVTRSAPGLVIHLPTNTNASRADAILLDHQFHLDRLQEKLDMEQLPTIHSYVYTNAAMKGSLLGGHNTMFAKPWLGEIHIHGLQVPHDVVAHELVHAIAAPLGTSILQITTQSGVIPNMGLIEGFAEAFTAPRGKLGLHEFARSMRDLNLAPKMQNLLSAEDFWRQAPARAYTIAGSFVRYLLEQYGAKPLKRLYAHADFQDVFDKDLDTLVKDWNLFLDTVQVPDSGRRTALAAFHRPAIFERPCAHVVADLRKELKGANPEQALKLHQKICDFEGQTPSAKLAYAFALKRAGNIDEFFKMSQALLEENSLRAYQKNKLYEQLGNVYWNRANLEEAAQAFQKALDLGVDLTSQRTQWVKLNAIKRPAEQSQTLMRYFTGKLSKPKATAWLKQEATLNPEDATLNYLYGRNLYVRLQFQEAIESLTRMPHPFPLIDAEIHRVVADAAWQSKQFEKAKKHYDIYRDHAPNSGESERASQWIERIKWQQKRNLIAN